MRDSGPSCFSVGRGGGGGGVGWLVLRLTALTDSLSVYIGPPPKERDKEERKDR